MSKEMKVVSGRRKTALAKARIKRGSGKIFINGLSHTELGVFDQLVLEEPLRIAKDVLGKTEFDIEIKVTGGGRKSQSQAARLAIAKALFVFTNSAALKKAFLEYDRGLLVADTRRKEAYKPGDSKARAMRQSSKR